MALLATLNAFLASVLGQEADGDGLPGGLLMLVLIILAIICLIVWLVSRARR